MKILKRILIVIAAIFLIAVVIGFFLPRHVKVERSLVINAPAASVHAQVNELKNWPNWSPWYEMDPNEKLEYSDPSSGANAWFKWESTNSNVQHGVLKLTASSPEKVDFALNFAEMGDTPGSFAFENADGGTKITWSFDSDFGANPIRHLMGPMMDKMLGSAFEKGLAKMKAYVESHPVVEPTPAAAEIQDSTAAAK